jgi:DNA-binding response OmpR family regulator
MLSVALIEDDRLVSNPYAALLRSEYPADTIHFDQIFTMSDAIAAVKSRTYDVVVLDVELGLSAEEKSAGYKVMQALAGKPTVVLVISGSDDRAVYKRSLLAMSAWDFLAKPFEADDFLHKFKQAVAWRRSQLKNTEASAPERSTEPVPGLVLDPFGRVQTRWHDQPVSLGLTRFKLLRLLVSNPDAIVPYSELFAVVGSGQNKANIRVHMQKMREAFQDAHNVRQAADGRTFPYIHNHMNRGYSWNRL